MTPEIPLLSMSREPRVRITEINPPRAEQANFFKRVEPIGHKKHTKQFLQVFRRAKRQYFIRIKSSTSHTLSVNWPQKGKI